MNGKYIATEFHSNKKCNIFINGLDIVSKYGTLRRPMIHLKHIYFGDHGTTDYNASLKIYINYAIFEVEKDSRPESILDDSDDGE